MNLQREFKQVRNMFFPRWDRTMLWKCRRVRDLHGAHGRCDTNSKVVKIAFDGGNLTLVLIHEICHAFGGGHGKKWQNRMEKAALHAEKIGRSELAAQVRKEVCGYQGSQITGKVAEIYGYIDDALMERPEATLMQVADWIRRDYGMSRKEFFGKYKRFKAEFVKKQRVWKKEARAQNNFLRERGKP